MLDVQDEGEGREGGRNGFEPEPEAEREREVGRPANGFDIDVDIDIERGRGAASSTIIPPFLTSCLSCSSCRPLGRAGHRERTAKATTENEDPPSLKLRRAGEDDQDLVSVANPQCSLFILYARICRGGELYGATPSAVPFHQQVGDLPAALPGGPEQRALAQVIHSGLAGTR